VGSGFTATPPLKPCTQGFSPHPPRPPQAEGLVGKLREAIEGPDADAREAALLAVAQLPAAAGRAAEPHLLPLVPLLLERAADKAGPARDAATAAAVAVGRSLCPYAAGMVLPVVFAHTDPLKKWQTREAALKMLSAVAQSAPAQVAARLPEIVPLIAGLMVDPREQVKAAAVEAGTASYHLVGNRDIEHLVGAAPPPPLSHKGAGVSRQRVCGGVGKRRALRDGAGGLLGLQRRGPAAQCHLLSNSPTTRPG
jgi:hypothetical protein